MTSSSNNIIKNTANPYYITVGYPNGTTANFDPNNPPTGTLQFRSGNVIDCIILNGQSYGGGGGGLSDVYTLPPNGQFQVTEIWSGDGNISNMTLLINGQTIVIGNGSHKEVACDITNLTVTLAGITYTDYVNQLLFAIVH